MTAPIILLEGLAGSRAYGLDTPDSDTDMRAVHALPTRALLGLDTPADSFERHNPDYVSYEARKFLHLILNGNPNITEMLWLDDYTVLHPWGRALVGIRHHLSAAPLIRQSYLGYATDQFRRLEARGDGTSSADTRNRTAKHARHLLRLLRQGHEFYATGKLTVRIPADQRDEIFAFGETVAAGDADQAKAMIRLYEDAFNQHCPALPDQPDTGSAAAWLAAVREDFYDPHHKE